jgi:hypothetical protein
MDIWGYVDYIGLIQFLVFFVYLPYQGFRIVWLEVLCVWRSFCIDCIGTINVLWIHTEHTDWHLIYQYYVYLHYTSTSWDSTNLDNLYTVLCNNIYTVTAVVAHVIPYCEYNQTVFYRICEALFFWYWWLNDGVCRP